MVQMVPNEPSVMEDLLLLWLAHQKGDWQLVFSVLWIALPIADIRIAVMELEDIWWAVMALADIWITVMKLADIRIGRDWVGDVWNAVMGVAGHLYFRDGVGGHSYYCDDVVGNSRGGNPINLSGICNMREKNIK